MHHTSLIEPKPRNRKPKSKTFLRPNPTLQSIEQAKLKTIEGLGFYMRRLVCMVEAGGDGVDSLIHDPLIKFDTEMKESISKAKQIVQEIKKRPDNPFGDRDEDIAASLTEVVLNKNTDIPIVTDPWT